MAKQIVKQGAKLDLTARVGGEEIALKSSYAGESAGKWRVSMPMANGKSVILPQDTPVRLDWEVDGGLYSIHGTVLGTVKQGVRSFLSLSVSDTVEHQERRAFHRIAAEIPVEICGYNTDHSGERVEQCYQGSTTDISNGGLAILTSAPSAVGEIISLTIARRGVKKLSLKAQVCWIKPAPRGSGYRDAVGLQFVFMNSAEGVEVAKLTAALDAKG